VIGQTVNRSLEKGHWLQWEYTISGGGVTPAAQIKPGYLSIAVQLDSKLSPGDILRPNDRVNILGYIGGKAYRIIKGVTVLGVAGESRDASRMQKSNVTSRAPRTYNSITVELPENVSLQWANLLTHVNGSCWVELLPANVPPSNEFNIINPELKKLVEATARPAKGEWAPGASGGPSGGTDGVTVPGAKTWE
jgi:hypothetical protein